jgi:hypothetical protein
MGFARPRQYRLWGTRKLWVLYSYLAVTLEVTTQNPWVRRQYGLSVLWVSSRAGNHAVYGHSRAKTQPSYYGPAPARGTETVGLRVAVTAVKRHKKTVVSPHGPHRSLPCRVRAACESLTGSMARLRNRITVPYSVLHGYGCQP